MTVTIDDGKNDLWVYEDDSVGGEIRAIDGDVTIRLLASEEACEAYVRAWEDEANYEKEMGLSLETKLSDVFSGLICNHSRLDGLTYDGSKQEILEIISVAEQVIAKARVTAEALIVVEDGTPLDKVRLKAVVDDGGPEAHLAAAFLKKN